MAIAVYQTARWQKMPSSYLVASMTKKIYSHINQRIAHFGRQSTGASINVSPMYVNYNISNKTTIMHPTN